MKTVILFPSADMPKIRLNKGILIMQIGAQLYTLRTYLQTESDIRLSLEKVAKMGYRYIQVSGMGKIDPHLLREICDQLELKIVLTHNPAERFLNDVDGLIEEHNILGCDYIGLGMMPEKYGNIYWIDQFGKDFLEPAKKIAAAGKLFMYHNHNFEFERLSDGRLLMEHLLDQLPAELMGITLDTYWVQVGGADIYQWLDILQDRIPCVHFKDMAVSGWNPIMAPVGDGNLNFPAIVKKLNELGKTKYALVEQDTCQGSPFDCLQRSYDYLRSLGL